MSSKVKKIRMQAKRRRAMGNKSKIQENQEKK